MVLITVVFIVGYVLIALERPLKVDKAAVALVTGGLCWFLVAAFGGAVESSLEHHLVDVASIVFFLLAAMTIVELIESFDGFQIITQGLGFRTKRGLLVAIAVVAFFLSAVLDNLTTTLVMLAITAKRVPEGHDRWLFAGVIVVAANAGGAFSPIGDVTTTMLWIGGQLTFPAMVESLFLPTVAALIVPVALLLPQLKGEVHRAPAPKAALPGRHLVFFVGLGVLLAVPVVKTVFHIPPYLSLLTGLGGLWVLTEILARGRLKHLDQRPSLVTALRKIDLPSLLFFIGILLAVAALEEARALTILAKALVDAFHAPEAIAALLGVFSAVFDNVPLVAAGARMFPLAQFPTDAPFWHWLAFTAGTGGSLLIIGSAAGVTAMGVARVPFGWYASRIGLPALAGYVVGLAVLGAESLAGF
jgi:Na+/H+ antiporter NhaD/arsenite permease-like protein